MSGGANLSSDISYTCKADSDCAQYVSLLENPRCGHYEAHLASSEASGYACVPEAYCGSSMEMNGGKAEVSCGGGAPVGLIIAIVGIVLALGAVGGVIFKKAKK